MSSRYSKGMKPRFFLALVMAITLSACSSFFSPAGWPVSVTPDSKAVAHMINHVKFTGSTKNLTKQEKALLTFLDDPKNVEAAIGEKNIEGAHQWSAAEVYLVDPGKHVSVLCENGYQQKPIYFHYTAEEKTWYRVRDLEPQHSKGVAALVVK